MHQVNFSAQSMSELKKFETLEQLELIEHFSRLNPELLNKNEDVGQFDRDDKHYFRIKFKQVRLYFEIQDGSYFVHYVLPQHTFSDFVFRFKLPVNNDWMVEQDQSFWTYLENLNK